MLGSWHMTFSGINVIVPLLGLIGGIQLAFLWSVLNVIIHTSVYALYPYSLYSLISVYHIPTFFASAYWRHPHMLLAVGIPLISMVCFILHASGSGLYALYWLIPIVIYFFPKKTLFMRALSATFIQHAVGSVLWLLLQPSGQSFWQALMPLVIVERTIFALAMMICIYGIEKLLQWRTGYTTIRSLFVLQSQE